MSLLIGRFEIADAKLDAWLVLEFVDDGCVEDAEGLLLFGELVETVGHAKADAFEDAALLFEIEFEVIIYTQDDPSVGQTVFHSHEQVVAINPETASLAWTAMSLAPASVSPEEMARICKEFGLKLQRKMEEVLERSA